MKKLFHTYQAAGLVLSFCLLSGSAGDVLAQKKKKDKDKNNTEQSTQHVVNEILQNNDDVENSTESIFVDGMKFFMMEEYEKAIKEFEKILKKDAQNAAAHFQIAHSYYNLQNPQKALLHAQKAAEFDAKNPYCYLLLGEVYKALNRLDEAEESYTQLIKLSKTEDYYYQLSNLYMGRNKFKEALALFDEMEKEFGFNPDLTRRKQMFYVQMRNYKQAIEEGEKLIEAFPDDSEYVMAQAELYINSKEIEKAEEILKKLLVSDPNDPQIHLMLAHIYQIRGEKDKNFASLKAAFQSPELSSERMLNVLVIEYRNAPSSAESLQNGKELASLAVKQYPDDSNLNGIYADFLAVAGEYEKSRIHYLKSLEANPDNFRVWERVLQIDLQMSDFKAALKHAEESIELYPNQPVFWLYQGSAHYYLQQNQEAIAVLEQGKMLASNNASLTSEFEVQLGDIYHQMGNYQNSDKAYENALSHNANNARALNNYSYFLSLRKEKLELAKEMSAKLVRMYPQEPSYLDTHGWVLYMLADYTNALQYIEKAAQKADSGTIVEHYGDVLYKLGKTSEALIQWKKAKEMGGSLSVEIDKKIKEEKLFD